MFSQVGHKFDQQLGTGAILSSGREKQPVKYTTFQQGFNHIALPLYTALKCLTPSPPPAPSHHHTHSEPHELGGVVAGPLGVDDLGVQECGEGGAVRKGAHVSQLWSEQGHVAAPGNGNLNGEEEAAMVTIQGIKESCGYNGKHKREEGPAYNNNL